MSKHSPSKRMKDKVDAQEDEVDVEEEEEEAILEEVEEDNRVQKIKQHMHQMGDYTEEVKEVKTREICNVIIAVNLIILSMSIDSSKLMKENFPTMEKKSMDM